jgi:hypothetical protein
MFTDTSVFWWPFTGGHFSPTPLPSVSRGGWDVLLEIAGLIILGWAWRRFGLADHERRQRFWRTGRLDPVPM